MCFFIILHFKLFLKFYRSRCNFSFLIGYTKFAIQCIQLREKKLTKVCIDKSLCESLFETRLLLLLPLLFPGKILNRDVTSWSFLQYADRYLLVKLTKWLYFKFPDKVIYIVKSLRRGICGSFFLSLSFFCSEVIIKESSNDNFVCSK